MADYKHVTASLSMMPCPGYSCSQKREAKEVSLSSLWTTLSRVESTVKKNEMIPVRTLAVVRTEHRHKFVFSVSKDAVWFFS